MFKQYKRKPSFPINKEEGRAGVGDKPPPPNFARSINANLRQGGSLKINYIQFDSIWTELNWKFEPIWTNLNLLDPIWSNLNQFYLIWTKY